MGRGSQRKRRSRLAVPPVASDAPAKSSRAKRLINVALIVVLVVTIIGAVVISARPDLIGGSSPVTLGQGSPRSSTAITVASFPIEPQGLDELLALSPEELE